MNQEQKTHCRFLEGTEGLQCGWEGPYKYSRGKPSLALPARGDKQTVRGIIPGMPFLYCDPALLKRSKVDALGADEYSYDWLIREQTKCSKFEPI